MNKIKIGIVGFGATGLSLFLQLIDDIIKLKLIDLVVINIFEKSDNIGCGLAYIMDFDCNILNRTSSRMSIRHEKPSDFYTWIKNNLHNVVKKYPGIDFLDINSYLPRSVFGLYLQDSYLNGLDLAKRNGVEVKIIQEEVVDVFINNNKFSIFHVELRQYNVQHFAETSFVSYPKLLAFWDRPQQLPKQREDLSSAAWGECE